MNENKRQSFLNGSTESLRLQPAKCLLCKDYGCRFLTYYERDLAVGNHLLIGD
jgi:hypothetical protein